MSASLQDAKKELETLWSRTKPMTIGLVESGENRFHPNPKRGEGSQPEASARDRDT
ncbi:MAG: hypothetical protein KGQ51_07890 [Planctomycetes bacterium]|nr:hypothetical protein [Planctomycetota bacterium]